MLLQISEPKARNQQDPLHDSIYDTLAVGIDLGTSNSLVAFAHSVQDIELIEMNGAALVPSLVLCRDDNIVVGNQVSLDERANAYRSFKRHMHDPSTRLKSEDELQHKTPVELSALLLDRLRHNAQNVLGKPVTKAVITVPAFFDETSRQATKDAAKLAGIEILRLISEPTAAALAYDLDHGTEGLYAVYDLGGGTFDFSILNMQKGVFHVLGTNGDTQLGGDDIDMSIAKLWGVNNVVTPQLLMEARTAKEYLTQYDVFQSTLDDSYGLTRDTLNMLLETILLKTFSIVQQTLDLAQLCVDDLLGVILVGGPTKMPYLQEKIEAFFRKTPMTHLDPDQIVARGAALQAHMLSTGKGTLLLDVTPLSLGIETYGGLNEKLITRNTQIPISVSQEFTTFAHGQTAMTLHVIQGENEIAANCRSLARFDLTGIPVMTAGMARVRVTFKLDVDGLLEVSATEITTGTTQQVCVKPSYGLTEDDLVQILNDHFSHAKYDLEQRLYVDAQVNAEKLIYHCEHALVKDGHLLTLSEKNEIQLLIEGLRNLLDGESVGYDEIQQKLADLKNGTQAFAHKRIEASINSI